MLRYTSALDPSQAERWKVVQTHTHTHTRIQYPLSRTNRFDSMELQIQIKKKGGSAHVHCSTQHRRIHIINYADAI